MAAAPAASPPSAISRPTRPRRSSRPRSARGRRRRQTCAGASCRPPSLPQPSRRSRRRLHISSRKSRRWAHKWRILRDEFISQMLEMNARIRQFPQMASIQLAGNSELSADGKQGKATDSNQSTTTDGNGTAATPPMSELQQPGRKPPRINAKFAILVDMYTRPTARRRQDRPCGAMAAAWALLHHAVVVALGRCDTGGSSGDGASTWWRREDRQGKRRQRRQEPFGDGGLERQGPAATTQTSSKGRQEEHQQPHRSIFCKLYVK